MVSTRIRKENCTTSDHLLQPNYWPGKETQLQKNDDLKLGFLTSENSANFNQKGFECVNSFSFQKNVYFVFDPRNQIMYLITNIINHVIEDVDGKVNLKPFNL